MTTCYRVHYNVGRASCPVSDRKPYATEATIYALKLADRMAAHGKRLDVYGLDEKPLTDRYLSVRIEAGD